MSAIVQSRATVRIGPGKNLPDPEIFNYHGGLGKKNTTKHTKNQCFQSCATEHCQPCISATEVMNPVASKSMLPAFYGALHCASLRPCRQTGVGPDYGA